MDDHICQPVAALGAVLDPSTPCRLEFNGSARRNPSRAGYGFAIVTADGRQLVAVGNGVLPTGKGGSQADYHALIEGLKAAQRLGLQHLEALGDSQSVVQQVQECDKPRKLGPLLAEVQDLVAGLATFNANFVHKDRNTLAEAIANWALDLDTLLLEADTCSPSAYAKVARSLGAILLLQREAVAVLDGADDFKRVVTQVVSSRLRLDPAAVSARMAALADSRCPGGTSAPACFADGLHIARTFTQAEAAALEAAWSLAGRGAPVPPGAAAARLLVGNHGSLPSADSQQCQQQQQLGQAEEEEEGAAGSCCNSQQQGFVESALEGVDAVAALEGMLLSDDKLHSSTALNDGRVTHVLMFDGASKNNPGRAGYGYAIFDLFSCKLAAKGCRTLPYGKTAHEAEYHGLVAGLEAAAAQGIRRILVQGDAALVVEQVMFRRCTTSSAMSRLFMRVLQVASAFEHFEIHLVPREENRVADRLAQIAIDVDGVLYALLRKDMRGEQAMSALLKAARLFKRNDRVALLLKQQDLAVLLVALLQSLMSLPPHELLERLEDKSKRMGDPNPWLVQEVRRVVQDVQRNGFLAFRSGSAASAALLLDGRTRHAKQEFRLAVGDEEYFASPTSRHAQPGSLKRLAKAAGQGVDVGSGGDDSHTDAMTISGSSNGSSGSSSSSSSDGGFVSGSSGLKSRGSGEGRDGRETSSRSGSSGNSGDQGVELPRAAAAGAAHYSTHTGSAAWHDRMGALQCHVAWPLLGSRQPTHFAPHLAAHSQANGSLVYGSQMQTQQHGQKWFGSWSSASSGRIAALDRVQSGSVSYALTGAVQAPTLSPSQQHCLGTDCTSGSVGSRSISGTKLLALGRQPALRVAIEHASRLGTLSKGARARCFAAAATAAVASQAQRVMGAPCLDRLLTK